MPDERLRAFVAIKPTADLHRACADVAAAGRMLPMRWARPASVHLTLKFLGDVRTDAVPAIHQALQRAMEGLAPFRVVVRGLGCFPNATRPRVLWVGLDDPQHELQQLQHRVESAFAALGIPLAERLFYPHLTLARARRTRPGRELDAFLSAYKDHTFGHLVVSQIHLMRSDLHAKGAVHTVLHSVALQGQAPGHATAQCHCRGGGKDVEIHSCNS